MEAHVDFHEDSPYVMVFPWGLSWNFHAGTGNPNPERACE